MNKVRIGIFIAVSLFGAIFTFPESAAESPESLATKISYNLEKAKLSLTEKKVIEANGQIKTSYLIFDPINPEDIGMVSFWGDKKVTKVEITASHFNDEETRFVAGLLIILVKTAILSSTELNDDVFIEMVDMAMKGKKPKIVTLNFHTVMVHEGIIVEGIPGLGMIFLTVDYHKPEPMEDSFIDQARVKEPTPKEDEGGCLIATAAYGTELSAEVQNLREIRNKMYDTEIGGDTMRLINQFYYSFSPLVADYERENPFFRDTVRILITPLMLSFNVLNHNSLDSESGLIGFVGGVILLNVGMYFAVPAILIQKLRNKI